MLVHYKIRRRDLTKLLKDDTHSIRDLLVDEYVTLDKTMWGETRIDQLISYCIAKQYDLTTVIVLEDSQGHKLHQPLIKYLDEYLNLKLLGVK